MEATDFDSSLPPPNRTPEEQRRRFLFTDGTDGFPPHLNLVDEDDGGGERSSTEADNKVKADTQIQDWVKELKSKKGAQLNYLTIQTFDELVDCVTMCIHITSPQHTAVNYLQNYYLTFVVNKPPCLFEKPPETLTKLLKYNEEDLVKALPMNQPAEWLLASHIPYLLNKDPDNDETLFHYAQSTAALYATKTAEADKPIAKAATDFLHYL
ncbi:putative lipoxygenase [Aspergillus puulaauensis]|uniref:Manganese lipoxygenase n=1 Tax=Aspergillus puulaauensis TaxID=1220207 RepID=A0A7R8AMG1_9EURO|nr:uncharacterized protein APUU_30838A [Aspergillus puulaauensis]BCS22613.1 hypothetical protein APUU_30838A [Aspergillus puulaauensis]